MTRNTDSHSVCHASRQAKRQVKTSRYGAGIGDYADILRVLDTLRVTSLHSGWSQEESGPCCSLCEILPEHFDGRADALKAMAGCRNPFQVISHCQCHIKTRKAVQAAVNNRLEFIVAMIQSVEGSEAYG